MPDREPLISDLKAQIQRETVIAVVGAGVSMSTVDPGQRTLASWTGLLQNGADRCRVIDPTITDKWLDRVRQDIESGDNEDLLASAEKISIKLQNGGEYGRWLQDTVALLKARDRRIIEALAKLPVQIATTNYDSLLEDVTGRQPVTWLQPESVDRWIRGDSHGILHLHGFWQDPKSVVLGIRSYDQVVGDERIQTLLKAIWATRTFLFIGYGKGLKDPNFGALLNWARRIFSNSPYRHFRLVRGPELAEIAGDHRGDRIAVLSYGDNYEDISGFLAGLAPAARQLDHHTPAAVAARDPAPPQGPDPPPPPVVNPQRSLSVFEVEALVFGLDDSQIARTLRVQFRSIAYSTADRPFYITGNEATSRSIVVPEHLSAYYQGTDDVLKLQCFDLPPGSRQIRARSMGNDPKKDWVPESWVFLRSGDEIEQLVPSAWDGEHHYALPTSPYPQRLFIVAVYRNGRVFYTGADQIWIEIADICGRVDRVLVWFGGKVRSVQFQNAFEFSYGEPLKFYPFPEDRRRSKLIDHKLTKMRFGELMEHYNTPESVRQVNEDQVSWKSALDVWKELCAAKSDQWWELELKGVTAHLVLTTTGKFVPDLPAKSRTSMPKGKDRRPK
jgi:hypothetical protein